MPMKEGKGSGGVVHRDHTTETLERAVGPTAWYAQ